MNSRTGPHSNRSPIMLSYYNTQSVIQSATVTRANNSSAISCSNSVTQRPLVTAHQLILRKRRLRNLRGKLSQHPLIAYLIPVTRCKNNSRGLLCRSVDIGRLSSPVSIKGTGPKNGTQFSPWFTQQIVQVLSPQMFCTRTVALLGWRHPRIYWSSKGGTIQNVWGYTEAGRFAVIIAPRKFGSVVLWREKRRANFGSFELRFLFISSCRLWSNSTYHSFPQCFVYSSCVGPQHNVRQFSWQVDRTTITSCCAMNKVAADKMEPNWRVVAHCHKQWILSLSSWYNVAANKLWRLNVFGILWCTPYPILWYNSNNLIGWNTPLDQQSTKDNCKQVAKDAPDTKTKKTKSWIIKTKEQSRQQKRPML